MKGPATEKTGISLSSLNRLIKSAITDNLPGQYWVIAEIADIKLNQKGHCYLELVEKEDRSTIAQIRASIWAYEYRNISNRFQKAAGEPLKQGMKILFLAAVTFHEVYGLSLNIKDIDPAYTMGDMALKKKEVIDRLRKEGLINRNKSVELPLVPQRIAVISSPTAAGYGDFVNQLQNNIYGYRFMHTLFPALMQGQEAEGSMLSAFGAILRQKMSFDIAVLIRGGGSATELNCFDGYSLASCIAAFPLPVITGIGHEKDDTVADIVAHTKMKTPTAVAEFLISGTRSFEEAVIDIENRIVSFSGTLLEDKKQQLTSFAQRLSFVPLRLTALHHNRLMLLQKDMQNQSRQLIQQESGKLGMLDQALRHLDPANVLKRGYSITRLAGRALKDASAVKRGAVIETELHKGTISSIVQSGKEERKNGKKQGNDLLPGFE